MSFSSTCLVEIDGSPLPADVVPLLVSAHVDDSQRLPDQFALRFRDPDRVVLDKSGARIGAPVRVSVATTEEQEPIALIHGEITALEGEFDGRGTFSVVRGYDPAHRLFRGRRTEAYTQMTAADIATKVAREAGLDIGRVESTRTVLEHVTQGGLTDWEFLQSLARDVGYEITVREGRFGFAPPASADDAPDSTASAGATDPLVLRLGQDLLRLRSVVTSAQQVTEVQVRGWDVSSKQALTSTATAETQGTVLPDTSPVALAHAFGDPTYVSVDVPYGTQAEVDAAADALAAEVAGSFAEFEGVVRGNPALRAGVAVTVDGLGSPFDGKYTVTTSRHRFDPTTGYTTVVTVTGRQERSLLGLASTGDAPAAPRGVVVGVVTDVNDPQGLGRVKISLPWLSDTYTSSWARTLQWGAGRDRGWMVLPEVGDEVLVAFGHGDVRRPFVLGGLHNGVDLPLSTGTELIDSGTGAVNRRSMVSRRGHRIDLLDQQGGADGVAVRTSGDSLVLSMDAASTTIDVHSDGTVRIAGTQGVRVDASSADLDLSAGRISLTATNGVTVDGGAGKVAVSTGGQLELSGATAKLEGSATTEVKGGAQCSLTAALVRIN